MSEKTKLGLAIAGIVSPIIWAVIMFFVLVPARAGEDKVNRLDTRVTAVETVIPTIKDELKKNSDQLEKIYDFLLKKKER